MTGSFPVVDHLRCFASASSTILTDTPSLVSPFWGRTLLSSGFVHSERALLSRLGHHVESIGPGIPLQILVEDRSLDLGEERRVAVISDGMTELGDVVIDDSGQVLECGDHL